MALVPLLRGVGAVLAVVVGAMAASIVLITLFGPRGEAGRPVGKRPPHEPKHCSGVHSNRGM